MLSLSMNNHPRVYEFGHLVLVFALTLCLYVATMPVTISLEDAGLFQMVCHLGGIGHPPGYPLFTAACQIFVDLPWFDDSVFAGNFLSSLFAAGGVAVFFSCCLYWSDDLSFAYIAAIAYGLSATFWSQAIIIEVYSLAVLLFLITWRLLLAYVDCADRRFLYAAIFISALGLSNHWPLMVLSGPALIVMLAPRSDEVLVLLRSPGFWLTAFACLALGLSPYLLLFSADPTIAVYGEVSSPLELLRYISRSAYSDVHVAADGTDRLLYMVWLLTESGTQFGVLGIPLVVAGLYSMIRSKPVNVWLSLLVLFLGTTFILNLLLNFRFEYFWQAIYKPYPVISYLALAFWFASGASLLINWIGGRFSRSRKSVETTLAVLILLGVGMANLNVNNRSRDNWISQYGTTLLATLPADSVLFVTGDVEIGVFGFLHHVAGVRPDIELRSWDNLVFENRLTSPFASDARQDELREAFLQGTSKPVFSIAAPLTPVAHEGILKRYTPGAPGSVKRNPAPDMLIDYLLALYLSELITDPHELYYAYHRLIDLSRYYMRLQLIQNDLSPEEQQRLHDLQATFPGKLATLETLLHFSQGMYGKQEILQIAELAEQQIPHFVTVESLAVFYSLYGRAHLIAPQDLYRAIAAFQRSIAINPDPVNQSWCLLAGIYLVEDNHSGLEDLRKGFPEMACEA